MSSLLLSMIVLCGNVQQTKPSDLSALDELHGQPVHLRVRHVFRAALLMRDEKGLSQENVEEVKIAFLLAGFRHEVYDEVDPFLIARTPLG